ncbi:hypothetical protein SAMN05216420_104166 [Nitrosospira sp. Nl5]|uniref:hypothetical protein n=1 Tax=Nitrosospira sp. Nl5 TaxID=200120 RepID=UPI0008868D5B|nr:hypothetical protein [Nitrosospira sp. Nl5]SCY30094.1 hypothetical protein SAMN05216420_104166 [Nitrosospira sp. Nl5]
MQNNRKDPNPINDSLPWGFHLTEATLRQIHQNLQTHAAKAGGATAVENNTVVLRDGSRLSNLSLDSILAQRTQGSKAIECLQIEFVGEVDSEPWRLSVLFQGGNLNRKSETGIIYSIVGPSRDWAVIASTEIKDLLLRAKKRFTWSYLLSSPWSVPFFLAIAWVCLEVLTLIFDPQSLATPVDKLEKAYISNTFANATEAIIFLERAKLEVQPDRVAFFALYVVGMLIAMFIVFWVVPRFMPSYIFAWGDALSAYEKRKAFIARFQDVIVGGLLVSLIGSAIYSFFTK